MSLGSRFCARASLLAALAVPSLVGAQAQPVERQQGRASKQAPGIQGDDERWQIPLDLDADQRGTPVKEMTLDEALLRFKPHWGCPSVVAPLASALSLQNGAAGA